MNIEAIVRAVQKELGIDQDGKVGPQTWEAIYERVCGKKSGAGGGGGTPKPPPTAGEKVDDRSEQVIATIQPEVRPYARALVMKARAAGITIQDEPHFQQFRPKWAAGAPKKEMLAELRSRKDSGRQFYA